jgi:hypothetical protein
MTNVDLSVCCFISNFLPFFCIFAEFLREGTTAHLSEYDRKR